MKRRISIACCRVAVIRSLSTGVHRDQFRLGQARAWPISRCATRPESFSTASTSRRYVPTSASAAPPQPTVHDGQPIGLPPVGGGNHDITALSSPPLPARFKSQDGNHGTKGATRVLGLFRQFKQPRRSQPSWEPRKSQCRSGVCGRCLPRARLPVGGTERQGQQERKRAILKLATSCPKNCLRH